MNLKTKQTQVFLFYFFLLTLVSCVKKDKQEVEPDNIESPELTTETPSTNILFNTDSQLQSKDSIIIDGSFLELYTGKLTGTASYIYESESFIFPPLTQDYFYFLDSLKMPNKNYYSRFFAEITEKKITIWMANYQLENNQYIDSRRLHYVHYDSKGNSDDYFHSILYTTGDSILVFDEDSMLDKYKIIPINIHSDGRFEEFADIPYSKDKVAIISCGGNGLDGKFPPKQEWTILKFRPEKDEDFVTCLETQNSYYDYVHNENTLFVYPDDQKKEFDIAFKGTYQKDYFELLQMKDEDISKNKDIKQLIFSCTLSDIYSDLSGINIIKLQSYTDREGKYWVAQLSDDPEGFGNGSLIGINPDKEVSVLSGICTYDYALFRMGNDIMLHTTSTSCGEGAASITLLYKLKNNFTLIYKQGITCD